MLPWRKQTACVIYCPLVSVVGISPPQGDRVSLRQTYDFWGARRGWRDVRSWRPTGETGRDATQKTTNERGKVSNKPLIGWGSENLLCFWWVLGSLASLGKRVWLPPNAFWVGQDWVMSWRSKKGQRLIVRHRWKAHTKGAGFLDPTFISFTFTFTAKHETLSLTLPPRRGGGGGCGGMW